MIPDVVVECQRFVANVNCKVTFIQVGIKMYVKFAQQIPDEVTEGANIKLIHDNGEKSKWIVSKLIPAQLTLEIQKLNKSDATPANG